MDAHRSVTFTAGPYVNQHAVISTAYNTVDFIRTMEEILGIQPLNLNDAVAVPMADVFDLNQTQWSFTAAPSSLLLGTSLPIPSSAVARLHAPKPTHTAQYWAQATKGMDLSAEDRIDFARYNFILWRGMMGNKPYPETSIGLDLSENRAGLLKRYSFSTTGQSGTK